MPPPPNVRALDDRTIKLKGYDIYTNVDDYGEVTIHAGDEKSAFPDKPYLKTVQLFRRRLQIAIRSSRVPHRPQHGKRCVLAIAAQPAQRHIHHPTSVHGSLARAGKVKSQTPKVEKQEKKKSPKGRAKKRMLYNRRYAVHQSLLGFDDVRSVFSYRFVNVTTLPGGKRRMYVLF
ncbi:ribosomal protein S30-domain-containing protein [Chiua virens]|nr:ribosomal protein S30-domain-containing protein [Chiua virens]